MSSGASGSASQVDTSLWLHNKLGTSNDSWTGGSIVSLLNTDKLVQINACFMDLQPQVKLKLLLSFFHIGRRNLEAWRSQLNSILSTAMEDSEPWVCMLADLMKTLPETGQLNSDIQVPESNKEIFHDLLTDLKKGLGKNAEKQRLVLPLECHYLNKNAFLSVVGSQPQNVKHFTLRRKPKAAALKAEMMNKSQEANARVKQAGSSLGSFPVRKSTMPRKMSDMPMKGLPSRPGGGGLFRRHGPPGGHGPMGSLANSRPNASATNANRKESGVKMLDITDQPLGYAAQKKRRKQEMEEAKKAAAEEAARVAAEKKKEKEKKEAAAAAAKQANAAAAAAAQQQAAAAAQQPPDYAAGLNAAPATPAAAVNVTPAYAPPTPTPLQTTPAYAPAPSSLQPPPPRQPTVPPPNLTPSVPPPPLTTPATLSAVSNSHLGGPHQPSSLIGQNSTNNLNSHHQQSQLMTVMQQQQQQQNQPQNLTSTSLSAVSNSRPQASTAALLVQQQPLLTPSQASKHLQNNSLQQQQQQLSGTTVIKTSSAAQAAAAAPFLGGLGPLPQSAVSTQMSQGTPSTPQHQQQRATGTTVIRQPQQQQQQPQLPTQPLPLQSAASAVSQQQQQQLHPQLQAAAPGARIVLPTGPIPQSRVVQMQTRVPGQQQMVIIGGQGQQGQQGQQQATRQQIAVPQNLITTNNANAARIIRPTQQQPQQTLQQTGMVLPAGNLQPTALQPAAAVGQPTQQQTAAAPPAARRQLTLTMQQKTEAQEMFRLANKVTRPEKALILGFMAGHRENPCPKLGDVVTIKLSENNENVLQTDQTYLSMVVETHFQMNYRTGEWKRIGKYRRIEAGAPAPAR